MESEVTQVLQGKLETSKSEKYQLFDTVLKWADEVRRLKVRANADVPDQARIARAAIDQDCRGSPGRAYRARA